MSVPPFSLYARAVTSFTSQLAVKAEAKAEEDVEEREFDNDDEVVAAARSKVAIDKVCMHIQKKKRERKTLAPSSASGPPPSSYDQHIRIIGLNVILFSYDSSLSHLETKSLFSYTRSLSCRSLDPTERTGAAG